MGNDMADIGQTAPRQVSGVAPIAVMDLTEFGVLGHFVHRSGSPKLVQYLSSLDGQDEWAVDYCLSVPSADLGEQFEVKAFLQKLEEVVATHVEDFHRAPEAVADLLSRLTTARSVYVLRFISEQNEAFTEHLAKLLSSKRVSESVGLSVLNRRLQALAHAQLLAEIFSAKRLNHIMQIMGSYADAY
jgi:hypothetical protein